MIKYFLLIVILLLANGFSQGLSNNGTPGFGEAQSPWKFKEKQRIFQLGFYAEDGFGRFANDQLKQETIKEGETSLFSKDIMDKVYMVSSQLDLALDWTNAWRSGLNQKIYFQNYTMKADLRLDERKGVSWGDLHYFDQIRLFQNKKHALAIYHELYIPWFDEGAGVLPQMTSNPSPSHYDVKNYQSADEFIQGLQLQYAWVPKSSAFDTQLALVANAGAKYYWTSQTILPQLILGGQAPLTDKWSLWGSASIFDMSFEQGARYRNDKFNQFEFYAREVPFQDFEKTTWKVSKPAKNEIAKYSARIQSQPKWTIGFKYAWTWSPRTIFKSFSNHHEYVSPQVPFASFGESYFIPRPVEGDSLPMPTTTVYKNFEIDTRFLPVGLSIDRLDSIVEQMFQHPVRLELRVYFGENENEDYNKRLCEEIGINIGNYLVEQGISKRRLRVLPMGKAGMEDWEQARLVTKVYSLPLEPPKKLVPLVDGVLEGLTFNRDGEITEEGEARLRLLSMQMEKFDQRVEFITRSNRSKDPVINLELSKALAKTIGDFLVTSGVSPEDLRYQHLGSQDIPETENEMIEIIVTKKEILE